jgi:molybdopterin molybdotransferase
MAQLTDDCFAFGGPLLAIEDVERLINARVTPVAETEIVALKDARGRVLAADVVAPIDLPPFDNSAVDGYAVRHADVSVKEETKLTVVDRLTAGRVAAHEIRVGEAVRIFTGAPMPRGADTVFMQEDVRTEDGTVIVPAGLKRGANMRDTGEDVRRGSAALSAGRRLQPQDLSMAAALGFRELPVRRRVRVAIFSTGDEIVEPGAPLPVAGLYDANRELLRALLARLETQVSDLGILHDDRDKLSARLAEAAQGQDLVLTSGGVSTGEADYVKDAIGAAGSLVFWRVAIKPGRPVAMGVLRGTAFVGLPGNPVAVFVTFARVVRPLLLRLAAANPEPLIALPVKAGFAYRKKKGRREYVRVSLTRLSDGTYEAHKHPQDGAGVISSLTATDGLAELTDDVTEIAKGDAIGFLPYSVLAG